MTRFFLIVGTVLIGLISRPADGQGVYLPNLSDTTISRTEYMKLELARKTVLDLTFTDADQVIVSQRSQIAACEQSLSEVVKLNTKTVQSLRDSLVLIRRTLQTTMSSTAQMVETAGKTSARLSNLGTTIRDAKRLGWKARMGTLGIGVVVGVLLPTTINLIKNSF